MLLRVITASVVFLALIAAVVSFGHTHELALRHGETSLNAMPIPLSVDGMVVASSMSVLFASRTGVKIPWLPWTLLILRRTLCGHSTAVSPVSMA